MPLVTVSVSVPEGDVGTLLRFAAELCEQAGDGDPGEGAHVPDGGAPERARWGWGRNAVRKAYLGGVSEYWRPMLNYLAERPDEWVAWPDVLEAIGLTAHEAAGMLGAAERRCKGRPPYEKRWNGDVREFRMPDSVAAVVEELAQG